MTTQAAPALTPNTTIGALVAARPALARLFEKLDIDYCCGGKQTLAAACQRRGLEVGTTIALLESAITTLDTPATEVNAAAMSLSELADHIVGTHHAYLKGELPRLIEMADRVASKHSWRDPRLVELAATTMALAQEMFSHMEKEETVLFPIVRQLESGAAANLPDGALDCPIHRMEAEHEIAGGLVRQLRTLTDGFTPDANACNTHRTLLDSLARLENDLHRHVHKENNILFPRSLALLAARN